MGEEIWLPVVGWEHFYEVSNTGKVRSTNRLVWNKANNCDSLIRSKQLKTNTSNTKGYERISLRSGGRKLNASVHRLVAQAFIPNPNNLPQVNHKDENKLNNAASNLEWCTNLDNYHYSLPRRNKNLEWAMGEKCSFNKHSENTIRKIPLLIEKGLNYQEIGKELGIAYSLIGEIKSGRAWKHLNLDIPNAKKRTINRSDILVDKYNNEYIVLNTSPRGYKARAKDLMVRNKEGKEFLINRGEIYFNDYISPHIETYKLRK